MLAENASNLARIFENNFENNTYRTRTDFNLLVKFYDKNNLNIRTYLNLY